MRTTLGTKNKINKNTVMKIWGGDAYLSSYATIYKENYK